jgi:4-aminobutyrate aminotransferase-like enzyme
VAAGSPSHLSDVWFSVTDLDVASGSGCVVTTTDGRSYLDFSAGIAVTSTGHCHPRVVAAIAEQAGRFIHAQANVYRHNLLNPLADRLAEITPDPIDVFFFANSGAEATEGGVKLARQATGRQNVIVFEGSFHGRTMLAMAMSTARATSRCRPASSWRPSRTRCGSAATSRRRPTTASPRCVICWRRRPPRRRPPRS